MIPGRRGQGLAAARSEWRRATKRQSKTSAETQVISGPFLDHLIRKNALDEVYNLLDDSEGKTLASYQDARRAINREVIFGKMLECIVVFEKSKQEKRASIKELFFRKSEEIWQLRSEARQLSRLVKRWILQQAVEAITRSKTFRVADAESMEEKTKRLQDFWPQFHNIGKNDLPSQRCSTAVLRTSPLRAERRKPLPLDSPGKVSSERPTTVFGSGSPLRRSPKALNTASPKQDLQWKTRAARSQCSAGHWDWWAGGSDDEKPGKGHTTSPLAESLCSSRRWVRNISTTGNTFLDGLGSLPTSPAATGFSFHPAHETSIDSGGDESFEVVQASAVMPSSSTFSKRKLLRWWQQPPYSESSPAKDDNVIGLSRYASRSQARLSASSSAPCLPSIPGTAGSTMMQRDLQSNGAEHLPPMLAKFKRPWEGSAARGSNGPTEHYLRTCHSDSLVPITTAFVTGHSNALRASGQGLTDKDLHAICDMLEAMRANGLSKLEELDLSGNSALSEQAIINLFLALGGWSRDDKGESQVEVVSKLIDLNLKGCVRLGQEQPISFLVSSLIREPHNGGLWKLRTLNISSVPLSVKCHLPLCKALRDHEALMRLSLADTNLGGHGAVEEDRARHCVEILLCSESITDLDLSWNCFHESVFEIIGNKLIQASILEKLKLSHCATVVTSGNSMTPMAPFLEQVALNSSLQTLDISENHLDFRSALILEDALEFNTTLTALDVSNNGLGLIGMRSLLRLLSRCSSALINFTFEQCGKGAMMDGRTDLQVFRASRPHGRYTLDLSRPYHRSLLRMLYKTAERLQLSADAAFRSIDATPAYAHPSKDARGIYQVPRAGKLALTFSMEKAVEVATSGLKTPDFSAVLDAHFKLLRIAFGPSKVLPILAQWKRLEGHGDEQEAFINALSKDFCLTYPQISAIGEVRAVSWDVVASLKATLMEENVTARFIMHHLVPTMLDFVKLLRKSSSLLTFTPENPTGHYWLDMANPVDYNVAEKIMILDNWETSLRIKNGRPDVSQTGNFSHVRNVRYCDVPLGCDLTDWIPLEYDVLELDYSSSKRAPCNGTVLDDSTFELIMKIFQEMSIKPSTEKVEALRLISNRILVTAMQLRQLIDLFKESQFRIQVYIIFFNRLLDIQNEKLARLHFESSEDQMTIFRRLGVVSCFPFMQPERVHFRFQMKHFDERLATSLLLKLAAKEGVGNVHEPFFTHADGTTDPLAMGIPKTWESVEKIPKEGVLDVEYTCKPSDRNFQMRKDLLEQFGGWMLGEMDESAVHFCSALNEVPPEVQSFVFWALNTYGDMQKCLNELTTVSASGDEEITSFSQKDFEEELKKLNFGNFRGSDAAQKWASLFRFIDSKGEGKILEWTAFDQIEKEIKLCLKEFVCFCKRAFGSDVSQATARFWKDAKPKKIEDWIHSCEKAQFFGCAIPLFKFMDKDENGSIDSTTFQALKC